MGAKYPEIEVELIGMDGNAFFILGSVVHEMKRAGLPQKEIDAYLEEARSGDYDHLLATTAEWVEIC